MADLESRLSQREIDLLNRVISGEDVGDELDLPTWGKIERAVFDEPDPGYLERLSTTFGLGVSDLKRSLATTATDLGLMSPEALSRYTQELAQEDRDRMFDLDPDVQRKMQEISGAETQEELLSALKDDPASAFSALVMSGVRSVPGSLGVVAPAAAAGAAAIAFPQVSVPLLIGGALAGGGVSGAIDYGATMQEIMSEQGVDVYDPDEVKDFFTDKEKLSEARRIALRRGIPIGAFDALSIGFAGSAARFARAIKRPLLRAGVASVGELGLQAAAGGGGEYVAQLASGRGTLGDVFLEAALEVFGPGAIEPIVNIATASRIEKAEQRDAQESQNIAESIRTKGRAQRLASEKSVADIGVVGAEEGRLASPTADLAVAARGVTAPQIGAETPPPAEVPEAPQAQEGRRATRLAIQRLPADIRRKIITSRKRAGRKDIISPVPLSEARDVLGREVADQIYGRPGPREAVTEADQKEDVGHVNESDYGTLLSILEARGFDPEAMRQSLAEKYPDEKIREQVFRAGLAAMVRRGRLASRSGAAERAAARNKPVAPDVNDLRPVALQRQELPQGTDRRFFVVPMVSDQRRGRGNRTRWSYMLDGQPSADTYGTRKEAMKAAEAKQKERGLAERPRVFRASPRLAVVERAYDAEGNPVGEQVIETYEPRDDEVARLDSGRAMETLDEARDYAAVFSDDAATATADVLGRQSQKVRQAQEEMRPVLESLRDHLKSLNLDDKVALRLLNVVLGKQGQVAEGMTVPTSVGPVLIQLATDVHGVPRKAATRHIMGVMNHEIIHAMRVLGLFTDQEWRALVSAARKRRHPQGGTFMRRAEIQNQGLPGPILEEEAVAEMFRAYADRPQAERGLIGRAIKRIVDLIKRFGSWLAGNGFQTPEDILAAIRSGEIGARPEGERLVGDRRYSTLDREPAYYSALMQALRKRSKMKARPDDWRNILNKEPGVKRDEILLSGVEEALRRADPSRSITGEELLQQAIDFSQVLQRDLRKGNDRALYGYLAEPGGAGYREDITRIPKSDIMQSPVNVDADHPPSAPHFNEDSDALPFGWVRAKRRAVDGGRSYFVEEIQSDLAKSDESAKRLKAYAAPQSQGAPLAEDKETISEAVRGTRKFVDLMQAASIYTPPYNAPHLLTSIHGSIIDDVGSLLSGWNIGIVTPEMLDRTVPRDADTALEQIDLIKRFDGLLKNAPSIAAVKDAVGPMDPAVSETLDLIERMPKEHQPIWLFHLAMERPSMVEKIDTLWPIMEFERVVEDIGLGARLLSSIFRQTLRRRSYAAVPISMDRVPEVLGRKALYLAAEVDADSISWTPAYMHERRNNHPVTDTTVVRYASWRKDGDGVVVRVGLRGQGNSSTDVGAHLEARIDGIGSTGATLDEAIETRLKEQLARSVVSRNLSQVDLYKTAIHNLSYQLSNAIRFESERSGGFDAGVMAPHNADFLTYDQVAARYNTLYDKKLVGVMRKIGRKYGVEPYRAKNVKFMEPGQPLSPEEEPLDVASLLAAIRPGVSYDDVRGVLERAKIELPPKPKGVSEFDRIFNAINSVVQGVGVFRISRALARAKMLMPGSEWVWAMDLTPEMKSDILENGFPLFSRYDENLPTTNTTSGVKLAIDFQAGGKKVQSFGRALSVIRDAWADDVLNRIADRDDRRAARRDMRNKIHSAGLMTIASPDARVDTGYIVGEVYNGIVAHVIEAFNTSAVTGTNIDTARTEYIKAIIAGIRHYTNAKYAAIYTENAVIVVPTAEAQVDERGDVVSVTVPPEVLDTPPGEVIYDTREAGEHAANMLDILSSMQFSTIRSNGRIEGMYRQPSWNPAEGKLIASQPQGSSIDLSDPADLKAAQELLALYVAAGARTIAGGSVESLVALRNGDQRIVLPTEAVIAYQGETPNLDLRTDTDAIARLQMIRSGAMSTADAEIFGGLSDAQVARIIKRTAENVGGILDNTTEPGTFSALRMRRDRTRVVRALRWMAPHMATLTRWADSTLGVSLERTGGPAQAFQRNTLTLPARARPIYEPGGVVDKALRSRHFAEWFDGSMMTTDMLLDAWERLRPIGRNASAYRNFGAALQDAPAGRPVVAWHFSRPVNMVTQGRDRGLSQFYNMAHWGTLTAASDRARNVVSAPLILREEMADAEAARAVGAIRQARLYEQELGVPVGSIYSTMYTDFARANNLPSGLSADEAIAYFLSDEQQARVLAGAVAKEMAGSAVYPAFLNIRNPILGSDLTANTPPHVLVQRVSEMAESGRLISRDGGLYVDISLTRTGGTLPSQALGTLTDDPIEALIIGGVDGIIYINSFEDQGSLSYVIFLPQQAASVYRDWDDPSQVFTERFSAFREDAWVDERSRAPGYRGDSKVYPAAAVPKEVDQNDTPVVRMSQHPPDTALPPEHAPLVKRLTGEDHMRTTREVLADKAAHWSQKLFGQVEGETWWQALRRNAVNQLARFHDLDRMRAQALGYGDDITRLGEYSLGAIIERAIGGGTGRIEHVIKHGMFRLTDPETMRLEPIEESRGLLDIFQRVGQEHKRTWYSYAIARNELEMRKRGVKSFSDVSDAELEQLIADAPDWFAEVHEDFQRLNSQVLDLAEAAGILDPNKRSALEGMSYIPYYRVFEEDMKTHPGEVVGPRFTRLMNNPKSALDIARTGGDEQLGDLYENIIRNFENIIAASLKNVGLQRLAAVTDELREMGIATIATPLKTPKESRAATYKMGFRRNGKRVEYEVHDPAMWATIVAMGTQFDDVIMPIARKFASIVRQGITLAPSFLLANLWRGKPSAFVISGAPLSPLATWRGLKQAFRDSYEARMVKLNTGFGGYTFGHELISHSKVFARRQRLQEGSGDFFQRVKDMIGGVADRLSQVGEATEMAERLAVYNKLIAQGVPETVASFEAVNVINFNRRGAGDGWIGGALMYMIPMIPFLNARLQGLYRLYENRQGRKRVPVVGLPTDVFLRGLLITFATTVAYLINSDDDRWDDETIESKVNYDIFYAGDKVIRIPRAFEVGSIFGAIPILLYDYAENRNGKRFAQSLASIFMNTLSFNPVPQFAKPLLEVYSGKNFFTGTPILGTFDRSLPKSLAFDERTSALGRLLGGWTGDQRLLKALGIDLAPKEWDHLITGYLGTVAQHILAATDAVLSGIGVIPRKPNGLFGDPFSPAGFTAAITGIERFVRDEAFNPSQSLREFYDLKIMASQLERGIKDAYMRGDIEWAQRKLAEGGAPLAIRKSFDRAGRSISEINRQIRNVMFNPDMSAAQKFQQLKRLRTQKINIAHRMVEMASRYNL